MSIEQYKQRNQVAFKKVARGGPTVLEHARQNQPGKYYASYAIDERNYAVVCFDTMRDFVEEVFLLAGNNRIIHYFEHLPSDPEIFRREAYDIDVKYSEISTEEKEYLDRGIDAFVKDFVELRNEYLEKVRDDWSDYLKPVLAEDMVVLEACNSKKFSVHILVPNKYNVGFTKEQVKVWQNEFNAFLEGRGVFLRVDAAAMSRTGHMRTVFSSKPSEPERKINIHQKGAAYDSAEYFICFPPRDRPNLASVDSRPVTVQSRASLDDVKDARSDIEKYLSEYSEFKVTQKGNKPEWRLDRLDSAACRVNAQAYHDSDGLLAFINNRGVLNLHCPRCSMTVSTDRQFDIVIPRKVPPIQPLKSRTDCMKKGEFESNNELLVDLISKHDTVYNACTTGMGKTRTAINAARVLGYKKVLYLHHRISLDDDLKSTYGLYSYREDGKVPEGEIMSCCFNSLFGAMHRNYGGVISEVELVIVDEVRSVFRQTKMKDQMANTRVLLDILQRGKKLLIMDACMRDDDVQFINSLRPEGGSCAVIGDEVREPIFNAELIEVRGDLQSALFAQLASHDFGQRGAVVLYNCSIDKMQAVLEKLKVEYIHINQQTRAEIDLSAANLSKYRLIVVSPTISEGVSFDSELFSDYLGYGCFQNGPNFQCAQAETCFQMCRRFRRVMHYTVLIKSVDFYPKFANQSSYKRVFEMNHLFKLVVNFHSPEWRFVSRVDIDGEKQRSSFTDSFAQFMVNNCFDVSFGEQEVFTSGDESSELKESVRALTREKYEEMATFGRLNDEQARALKSSAETRDDYLKLEKHYIERSLRMVTTECSADVLQYYGTSRTRLKATLYLRELLSVNFSTGNPEDAASVIERVENAHREDFAHADSFSEQKPFFFRAAPLVFRFANEVVLALGWSGLFDTSPKEVISLDKVTAYLVENHERISYCIGANSSKRELEKILGSEAGLMKYVKALLFRLGISIIQFKGAWRMVCLLKHVSPNGFKEDHVTFNLSEGSFTEAFFIGDKTFVCPSCNCDFSAVNFDKHVRSCAPKPKKQKVIYECKFCGEEFTDKSKHAKHERGHEQTRKQAEDKVCPHCSKKFSRKQNRDIHAAKCTAAPK